MAETRATVTSERLDWDSIFRIGIVGGILAGIAMMMVEMLWAAAMGMSPFVPPRMIAGIVFGMQAMEETFPLLTALGTTLVLHMLLSIIYGVVFTAIVATWRGLRTGGIVLLGLLFGLAIWIVNFYVIAPAAGWTWFPEKADPIQQFVAHAIAFGGVLGWYTGTQAVPERVSA